MEFQNRIKKEMTEGIIKAILEDAGYRVIDTGIEKVIRELSCLTHKEYRDLDYPTAIRNLPDFTVMDKDQKRKFLVEVKYRSGWSKDIFKEIEDKVAIFGEIILVCVNADPPPLKNDGPSGYVRCCSMKLIDGKVKFEMGNKKPSWKSFEELSDERNQWWNLSLLQDKFEQIKGRKNEGTLFSAIAALAGILRKNI